MASMLPDGGSGSQPQAASRVMEQPSADQERQHGNSWVQCSACRLWRRVPKELSQKVEGDNMTWYCRENPDPGHNSCSVPQEMSDAAIDIELAQNTQEEEADTVHKASKKPAVWQLISRNIYTHRERKREKEDDIMICNCAKPADGSPGCGVDCLNRRLNVECHPEWCPCGTQCSNRMFAQRQYAKITQRRAGAKGFGLFTCEDLKAGQFIIEYIGEVLEEDEYHRRKGFYLESAQRHYYFMNVGNGEVIDACRKGALGRFINHSCEPNCETQKWLVHGELAIGLFTTTDIPADTELTFDYNFERYGDKPLKCLCGSARCRGVIGGKEAPPKAEDDVRVMEQAVSAIPEEPEPIMIEEAEQDDLVAAILDANVGLRKADTKRLNKLAGRHGISKDWSSDDGGEDEADEEEHAETNSKGSMNRPSASGSRAQSDAETEHSNSRRWHADKTDAKRLLNGRKRLTNGSAYSRMDSADLQHVRSSLLDGRAPSRKRARAAFDDDRDSSPTASTAQRSQDRAVKRPFLNEGGATSKPFRNRSLPRQRTQQWNEAVMEKRRSEVDRRLDSLINQSTRALRQVNRNTVLKLLRLFNLCDLGTNSADKDKAKQAYGSPRRGIRARTVQNAVDQSEGEEPHLIGRGRGERQAHSSTASGHKQASSPRAGPAAAQLAMTHDKAEVRSGSTADRLLSTAQQPSTLKAEPLAEPLDRVKTEALASVKAESGSAETPTAVKAEADLGVKAGGRTESGEIGHVPDQREAGQRGTEATAAGLEGLDGKLGKPGLTVKVKAEAGDGAASNSPSVRLRDRDAQKSPRSGQRAEGSLPKRPRSRSRSRERNSRGDGSPFSRGTDTEEGEVKEPSSPVRPGLLSARQQARLADLSLLLEVILQTDYARAPEEFVKWGTLRQLHTMLSRCIGPHIVAFDLIMRKMLEVVKALPFTADDLHHTRNAHGTFIDTLYDLANKRKAAKPKSDKSTPALTTAALDLVSRFPGHNCKTPVALSYRLRSPRGGRNLHSPAGSARGSNRGWNVHGGMPPGRVPTGRIVDWKPPGRDTAQQPSAVGNPSQPSSRDSDRVQQMATSESKKRSPDATMAKLSPHVMRATYVQSKPDATPGRTASATPHAAPVQPYMTPTNRPAGAHPTPLSRSQSFAAGQREVGSTLLSSLAGSKSLHRLSSARGPASPPHGLNPSPSLPPSSLLNGSRWAPVKTDAEPTQGIHLPQPPAGPPPSTSQPISAGITSHGHPAFSSSRTQQMLSPYAANPPLPVEPAGPMSPDPPLPLSPPPQLPLPPPPQRPPPDSNAPLKKDFGLPPHLSDVHLRKLKRKQEGAQLNGEVGTDDMSLDEGEIPADAHHDTGVHVQSNVSLSRSQSASGSHGRRPAEPSANGHSQHSDWPVDWPDANLTSNQSFLSFVEFAVRQALQTYRSSTGHDDIQLSQERHDLLLEKCIPKIIAGEQQAASQRAARMQKSQVVRHKVQINASKLVTSYVLNESKKPAA